MRIRFFSIPRRRLLTTLGSILLFTCTTSIIYLELGFNRNPAKKLEIIGPPKSERHETPQTFTQMTTSQNSVHSHPMSKAESPLKSSPRHFLSQCPTLEIRHGDKVDVSRIACKEHRPAESGCKFAKKAYAYDDVKRTCRTEPHLEICRIVLGQITCTYKQCADAKNVSIHILDNKTGIVKPIEYLRIGDDRLNKAVSKYARITIKNGHKFMFLSCGAQTQLLLLSDKSFSRNDKIKMAAKKLNFDNLEINVNLVMIDSLSRAHFYRSLHRTIKTFQEINQRRTRDVTEVLDFRLFQALHGHSAENAHALFNGSVFPTNYTESEKESNAIGLKEYFGFLKKNGYNTMYQDDECWEAIWGFRQDIGGASDWIDLIQKQAEGNIDEIGLTYSNCKLFDRIESKMTFNLEEENYVCYNGRMYDAYHLDYIQDHFELFDKSQGKKSFSYSVLCADHDYGGVRIQALDKDLSTFVRKMAKLEKTITVIFADHGNTYTDFVYVDLEGKYEMFHPSLFMIVPKGVQEQLGPKRMKSLRSNQHKLVSVLDLHHSFKYLADTSYKEKGLFSDISASRTCEDLPLRFPNLCACEGSDTVVKNDTEYIGQLEFAIGQLNNLITHASNFACKRLVPTLYMNVLQRKSGDNQIVDFEIETSPGVGYPNKPEKINVEVTTKISGSLSNFDMKLASWERISRFGKYATCSDVKDTKFRFRLCVCDKDRPKINDYKEFFYHRTSRDYSFSNEVIITEEFNELVKDTLVVVERAYQEKQSEVDVGKKKPYLITVTFEVINYSPLGSEGKAYSVEILLDDLNNIKPLTSGACKATVPSRSVVYICSLNRKWNIWQAEYSYKVKHEHVVL